MSKWYITFALASLPGFWVITAWLSGIHSHSTLSARARRVTLWGTIALSGVLLTMIVLFMSGAVAAPTQLPFKITPISALIICLVMFLGIVLMRYSRNYMVGEDCYPAFFRWITCCLAAVVVTLLANHMLLFLIGWISISLSLHKLLTLYPDRSRALLAAHKKFLLARLSELLVLSAFILLYVVYRTLYIDELLNILSSEPVLTPYEMMLSNTASMLLAIAALLKCAQLPFHGWLINVVETPTPVSALLHAGIINLGGYLMLAFAPLIAMHSDAQWVLLVGAGMSMLFAALIMTTRISVKVRLAWSTSAQMGLMLVECGLGLYELAVLHLIAHSLYKAHAFLNSGNAVYETLDHAIADFRPPTVADWANAVLLTAIILGLSFWVIQWHGPISPWVLLAASLGTFLATRSRNTDQTQLYIMLGLVLAITASYLLLKVTIGYHVTEDFPAPVSPLSMMDIWMVSVFSLLFFSHLVLEYIADKPWVKHFRHLLFAGLYLDEWFTRVTLWIWPVKTTGLQFDIQHSSSVANIRRP